MNVNRTSQTMKSTQGSTIARIQDEIEFARALSALILAARLEEAEYRSEEAYQRIVGSRRFGLAQIL